MHKRFIPYAHAKSIYDIDIDFFSSHDVKILLIDLDNTLDSYKTQEPSQRAIDLKNLHHSHGISWYIVSNNTGKRVKKYAESLGVPFLSSLRKPFSAKLNKKLQELGIDKAEVMMIGDQVVTDICSANGAHIRSILTDKIVPEDQPTTHFNRLFDRPLRKKLIKGKLLREWEDIQNGDD